MSSVTVEVTDDLFSQDFIEMGPRGVKAQSTMSTVKGSGKVEKATGSGKVEQKEA